MYCLSTPGKDKESKITVTGLVQMSSMSVKVLFCLILFTAPLEITCFYLTGMYYRYFI